MQNKQRKFDIIFSSMAIYIAGKCLYQTFVVYSAYMYSQVCLILLRLFKVCRIDATSLIALFSMLHLVYGTTDLREPRQTQSPSLSPITHGSSSSSSSPSSRSPFASSLTRSVFHSELKTWLFGKSFPP